MDFRTRRIVGFSFFLQVTPSSLCLNLTVFLILANTAKAFIKGPPEVSADFLQRYVAKEGDTVKLVCPITGSPKPMIEWYQDDHMIQPTWERFKISRRFLKLKEARLSDSGVFVCKGVNGFGSESVSINLVVRDHKDLVHEESPPFQQQPPQYDLSDSNNSSDQQYQQYEKPRMVKRTPVFGDAIEKEAGETLRLECFVDGSPPPTITWYKDDDILLTPNLENERIQTTLIIPNLEPSEDAGVYKCKARNGVGEINATFPVKINDTALHRPTLQCLRWIPLSVAAVCFGYLHRATQSPSTPAQKLLLSYDNMLRAE